MAAPTQCVFLDGDGDGITVATDASYACGTNIGLGMWICRDYADDSDVVLADRNFQFELAFRHDFLVWHIYAGAGDPVTLRVPAAKVKRERPTMISAIAFESGDDLVLEIYIDGSMVGTQTYEGQVMPDDPAGTIYFGSNSGGTEEFRGSMSSIWLADDHVLPGEIAAMFASATGQATDTLDNLSIDIDTEGDLANAGDGGAGTLVGNAAYHSYMGIFQAMGNSRVIYIPTGETGYRTHKQISPTRLTWTGDTIADGDELIITDYDGNELFSYISVLDDQGGTWYFGPDEIWNGMILTNPNGELKIGVR